MQIKFNYFHAIILPDEDPQNRGRYKVHIPYLHQHISRDKGIWATNRTHTYRDTSEHNYTPAQPPVDSTGAPLTPTYSDKLPMCGCPGIKDGQTIKPLDTIGSPSVLSIHTPDTTDMGNYGQYFPLHPGTHVIVFFPEDDPITAEIIKIIHDKKQDQMPLKIVTHDRNELTQIIRTARHDNIFAICERTISQPSYSTHLYTNLKTNKFIWDEHGYHRFVKRSIYTTVERSEHKKVNHTSYININRNKEEYICGNYTLQVDGTFHLKVGGDIHIEATGSNSCALGDIHIIAQNSIFQRAVQGLFQLKSNLLFSIQSMFTVSIKAASDIINQATAIHLRSPLKGNCISTSTSCKSAFPAIDPIPPDVPYRTLGYEEVPSQIKELNNVTSEQDRDEVEY